MTSLSNAQKTWIATSIPAANASQIQQALHSNGNSLPCSVTAVSGQLVTIKFEVNALQTLPAITVPIATSEYDWLPVQVGDKGLAEGGTIYIGGISGQGGGVADLTPRGNLSCLVFRPISNAAWTVGNPNQRVIQAPAGVLIQTANGMSSVNVTDDAVTITAGGKTWVFNASGGTLSDGVVAETHIHHQGADSHGDTEQPTSAPVNP